MAKTIDVYKQEEFDTLVKMYMNVEQPAEGFKAAPHMQKLFDIFINEDLHNEEDMADYPYITVLSLIAQCDAPNCGYLLGKMTDFVNEHSEKH